MEQKEILYLGYLIDPSTQKEFTGASTAGVQFEWNLISSLAKDEEVSLASLSVSPIAPWPKDRRLRSRANTGCCSASRRYRRRYA